MHDMVTYPHRSFKREREDTDPDPLLRETSWDPTEDYLRILHTHPETKTKVGAYGNSVTFLIHLFVLCHWHRRSADTPVQGRVTRSTSMSQSSFVGLIDLLSGTQKRPNNLFAQAGGGANSEYCTNQHRARNVPSGDERTSASR